MRRFRWTSLARPTRSAAPHDPVPVPACVPVPETKLIEVDGVLADAKILEVEMLLGLSYS